MKQKNLPTIIPIGKFNKYLDHSRIYCKIFHIKRSFDGFKADAKGYNVPENPKYADQVSFFLLPIN